jgi:urease accessory protein
MSPFMSILRLPSTVAVDAIPLVIAHSQIAGVADFWNGMLHPLLSPAHVLILAGLGLLMGQQAPRGTTAAAASFGTLFAIGLAITMTGWVGSVSQPLLLFVAMCAAILIVTGRAIPSVASVVLHGGAGLLLGLDSRVDNVATAAAIKMSAGTWLCGCLVAFNVAFYASRLTRPWHKVAIRVAGSWVLAISMLVIAFALRG